MLCFHIGKSLIVKEEDDLLSMLLLLISQHRRMLLTEFHLVSHSSDSALIPVQSSFLPALELLLGKVEKLLEQLLLLQLIH